MKFISGLILAAVSLSCDAALVRLSYSGSVSSLTYADCKEFVGGSCKSWDFTSIGSTSFVPGQLLAVGDRFHGSFVYETETASIISDDGYQATYLGAMRSSDLESASFALPNAELPTTASGGYVAVVDGRYGADVFQVGANYSGLDYFSNTYLSLVDLTGSAFSGFAIPAIVDVSRFGSVALQVGLLRRVDGDQVQMAGRVDSIVFSSSVPEPSTALLTLVGVAAFAASRQLARPKDRARKANGASSAA